jgi:hypothetical protein
MAKAYTDLCAFKRFLKSQGVLRSYKQELKRRYSHVRDPWRKFVAIPSKRDPVGLYNIINLSLNWASVTTIDDCVKLCQDWDMYWIKTCGPKYLKQYGSKIPTNLRNLIERNIHV